MSVITSSLEYLWVAAVNSALSMPLGEPPPSRGPTAPAATPSAPPDLKSEPAPADRATEPEEQRLPHPPEQQPAPEPEAPAPILSSSCSSWSSDAAQSAHFYCIPEKDEASFAVLQ